MRKDKKLTEEEKGDLEDYLGLKENPEGDPVCQNCCLFDTEFCDKDPEFFNTPSELGCKKYYT